MKFQTVIIGGGLSGLMAGIELARHGKSVAIVSSGQSALHFSSGSLELLSQTADGTPVTNPLQAIDALAESHPYKKIGTERISQLASGVTGILADAGIEVSGSEAANHYRITPMGKLKPAWLTLSDYPAIDNLGSIPWKKVCIVNLKGYLDFYPQFLAHGLENIGIATESRILALAELDHLRKSPSEMRAANIARTLTGQNLEHFAKELARVTADSTADVIFMPAVLGLTNDTAVKAIRSQLNRPIQFIATLPASVPGIRTQLCLRAYFQKLGGAYMLGDSVTGGTFGDDGLLKSISTAHLGPDSLQADHFVLASGSFFSHGLTASPDKVKEPIFGLDVHADKSRSDWFKKDLYSEQPFMTFGIETDHYFRAVKDGKAIPNLYGCGSVLAGANSLKEGSGAGVAILTALTVAQTIYSNRSRN